jgi:hypothetical protein
MNAAVYRMKRWRKDHTAFHTAWEIHLIESNFDDSRRKNKTEEELCVMLVQHADSIPVCSTLYRKEHVKSFGNWIL